MQISEPETGFKKSLNLFDSTAIVIGSMIGSGIFIVSADIARTLGSPGWLLVVWLITGVLTVTAALSYGELAGMMPKAGGQYVYLREAYNPFFGFLYGWTLFLVIQTGTIAAVAMGFGKFFGVIIPWFSEKNILIEVGLFKFHTVHILAIGSVIFLTWINSKGIKIGKIVQGAFTFTKVFVLIVFIIIGLFFAHSVDAISINKSIFWDAVTLKGDQVIPLGGIALIIALGTAMVGSLFSSDAWVNITFTASEVLNPKRNIPLSLFFGVLIVTIIYILANIVYLGALPLRGISDGATVFERGVQYAVNDRLGTAAMTGLLGEYAAIVMAIFVVISTFGCNNGLVLSGPRVYYAMAEDGLFFKKAGNLNSEGVPQNGLIVQCIWACLLCISGTYSDLLDYVIFSVLIFYVLTIAGIFILRSKRPDIERPYKAFGYPIVPGLYILLAGIIMIILLLYKPKYTFPGLIIVLLGIPVYFIWRKVNKT